MGAFSLIVVINLLNRFVCVNLIHYFICGEMLLELFSKSITRTMSQVTARHNLGFVRNFRAVNSVSTRFVSANNGHRCNSLNKSGLLLSDSLFSKQAKRAFCSSNVSFNRAGSPTNGDDFEGGEEMAEPMSLSEAITEELKFSSSGADNDNEISFPGSWGIQKLGARVIMTQKTANKKGVLVRLSFSVNPTMEVEEDGHDPESLMGEEGHQGVDPSTEDRGDMDTMWDDRFRGGREEEQHEQKEYDGEDEEGDEEYLSPESYSPKEASPIPDAISIEIKKNGKVLNIDADIDIEGPIIRSISFNREMNAKKNDKYETYEINFDILSVPMQDAVFNYLQELGLSEAFFANLHDWAANYEQSLFVGTLNELKQFSE